jgi:hypothetical protein
MARTTRKKILDPIPLIIPQSIPMHGQPLKSRPPMSQRFADSGIPYLTQR